MYSLNVEIFCIILSVPKNIVMDLNNVMSIGSSKTMNVRKYIIVGSTISIFFDIIPPPKNTLCSYMFPLNTKE